MYSPQFYHSEHTTTNSESIRMLPGYQFDNLKPTRSLPMQSKNVSMGDYTNFYFQVKRLFI
jgi:hypothetical protein